MMQKYSGVQKTRAIVLATIWAAMVGDKCFSAPKAIGTNSKAGEAVAATQQGLIVSTIAKYDFWPGSRPAGIQTRLGYPSNYTPNLTDDQLIIDMALHHKNAYLWTDQLLVKMATMTPDYNSNSLDIATRTVIIPPGVNLPNSTATTADKEYLTLAMLKRAGNPAPPASFTPGALNTFSMVNGRPSDKRGQFRLLNLYGIKATASNSLFSGTVQTIAEAHTVGPTPFRLFNEARIGVGLPIGPLYNRLASIRIRPGIDDDMVFNATTGEFRNGETIPIIGFSGQTAKVRAVEHRTASRIGVKLRPYEQALLQGVATPPFSSHLQFEAVGNNIQMRAYVSAERTSAKTWPSAYVYQYNFRTKQYNRLPGAEGVRNQISSPYQGFLNSGPEPGW